MCEGVVENYETGSSTNDDDFAPVERVGVTGVCRHELRYCQIIYHLLGRRFVTESRRLIGIQDGPTGVEKIRVGFDR